MHIVADSTCSADYGTDFDRGRWSARAPHGGVDTCAGDSGGPLQAPVGGGGYRLVGITAGVTAAPSPMRPASTRASPGRRCASLIESDVASLETTDWPARRRAPPARNPGATTRISTGTATNRLREVQAHPRQEEAEALREERPRPPEPAASPPPRAGARLRAEGSLEIVLRVVLGIVLASAALAKLASPRASIGALDSFGFEEGPLRPVAWAALIAVELALAVAVALGSDAAAYAAAGLMAMFAALTVAALLRGRAGAPCACFGPRSRVSWLGVLRNLALAAAFALVPSVDSISIGTAGLDVDRDRRRARRLRRPGDRGARRSPARSGCCASSSARRARSRSPGRGRRSARAPEALARAPRPETGCGLRPRGLHLRGLRYLPDPRAGDRERGQGPAGRGWPSSTRSRRRSSGASWRSPAAPSRSRSIARARCSPRGPSTTSRSSRASWRRRSGGGSPVGA